MASDKKSNQLTKTGLVYDSRCDKHESNTGGHQECAERTQHIWEGLRSVGLINRCSLIPSRLATDEEISLAHDIKLVARVKKETEDLNKLHAQRVISKLEAGKDTKVGEKCKWFDEDTYFNRFSEEAARLSCGGLLALCDELLKNKSVDNGFAVIRPPGHHADHKCAQGFCIFNNVAIAANYVLKTYSEMVKKVLIVDWDVHHGNGTQNLFWDRKDVLYFSIHRYEHGEFYPKTGHPQAIGGPDGQGHNINMPLNGDENGDPEYLLTWEKLLIPIATAFKPDIILVSAGFDCAVGDPLGQLQVSTNAFGHLTQQLMQVNGGTKVIIALEGGYNLQSITDATISCVKALLKDTLPTTTLKPANLECVEQINSLVTLLSPFWPTLTSIKVQTPAVEEDELSKIMQSKLKITNADTTTPASSK